MCSERNTQRRVKGGPWRLSWSVRKVSPGRPFLARWGGVGGSSWVGGEQLCERSWLILFIPAPGMASSGFLFSFWMLRYPADCTPAHRDWGTPCLHANIQGPRDPCVQLCAPALVKPAPIQVSGARVGEVGGWSTSRTISKPLAWPATQVSTGGRWQLLVAFLLQVQQYHSLW